VGAGFDDVGVEGDAVDDGGDEAGVGDDLAPFAEGQVRGQSDRGLLFTLGQDLEQQLRAAGVELDVAELVEAEQIEAAVAGDESGQASFVGGFGEFVGELRGGEVRTRSPASQAARPRPMSRWDLPVPESPSRTTGSPVRM
jgi:hypothetical protein